MKRKKAKLTRRLTIVPAFWWSAHWRTAKGSCESVEATDPHSLLRLALAHDATAFTLHQDRACKRQSWGTVPRRER